MAKAHKPTDAEVRSVACATCGAKPGDMCTKTQGEAEGAKRYRCHLARYAAYHQWNADWLSENDTTASQRPTKVVRKKRAAKSLRREGMVKGPKSNSEREALAVPCPSCSALVGLKCVSKGGHLLTNVHVARIDALIQARHDERIADTSTKVDITPQVQDALIRSTDDLSTYLKRRIIEQGTNEAIVLTEAQEGVRAERIKRAQEGIQLVRYLFGDEATFKHFARFLVDLDIDLKMRVTDNS